MKLSLNLMATLTAAFMLTACGGTSNQSSAQADEKLNAQDRTIDLSGEQRFEDMDQEGDVTINDHQYHYAIHRTSSDELPLVTGDFSKNAKFHDNVATLTIMSGDRKVLQSTYTKNNFSNLVEPDMLSRSVLRGFVFDPEMNQDVKEITFAISVGYPQDDEMYVPLLLKVTPDGKVSMEKDTTLDMSIDSDLSDEEGV